MNDGCFLQYIVQVLCDFKKIGKPSDGILKSNQTIWFNKSNYKKIIIINAFIYKESCILILKYLGFVYKLFLIPINKMFYAKIYFCDLLNYFFYIF